MADLTVLEEKLAEVIGLANEQAGDQRLQELIDWALPIQERHFEDVKAGSIKLAAEEDPSDTA
jgi:hypothetical protein